MPEQEPLIVGYGRYFVDKYSPEEYRSALVKAFRQGDFVVLDDNMHGQRFLAASVAWAIDNGYLYCSQSADDTQSVVSAFRLTELGEQSLK